MSEIIIVHISVIYVAERFLDVRFRTVFSISAMRSNVIKRILNCFIFLHLKYNYIVYWLLCFEQVSNQLIRPTKQRTFRWEVDKFR